MTKKRVYVPPSSEVTKAFAESLCDDMGIDDGSIALGLGNFLNTVGQVLANNKNRENGGFDNVEEAA